MLVADIEAVCMSLNGKRRGSGHIRPEKLIERVCSFARRIDIKGWLDEKRIAILMPETEATGALEVKEKICHKIPERWPSAEYEFLKKSLTVYTFSNDSPEGNGSLGDGPGADPTAEDFKNSQVYADLMSMSLDAVIKRASKRSVDILGSFVGIILIGPLMLIIGVLIKLTSPGPVLFRQERVGLFGKRFVFLKFRSMFANVDQGVHERYIGELINGHHEKINQGTKGKPLYKMSDDTRVTPIGRILRKTSLDELPQLFNILKGDMSLVGPRPPIPYEVENYKFWHHGRVLEVKPGLTGLWQVSGRSQTSFDDMVRLDLRYANTWSLWLDLKIILRTFHAVLSTKGAY
jgi:lipopolysaccharide/colanic/teichoic acid biosynthesis glycosyltransferase